MSHSFLLLWKNLGTFIYTRFILFKTGRFKSHTTLRDQLGYGWLKFDLRGTFMKANFKLDPIHQGLTNKHDPFDCSLIRLRHHLHNANLQNKPQNEITKQKTENTTHFIKIFTSNTIVINVYTCLSPVKKIINIHVTG